MPKPWEVNYSNQEVKVKPWEQDYSSPTDGGSIVQPQPAPGDDIQGMINTAAQAQGVDPRLLTAMARAESNFDPSVTSPAGAQGLMQFMPATGREYGVVDPFDPQQSATGGAKYIKKLLDQYGGDTEKALAAYNWGMGNLAKSQGGAYPEETQNYITKIMAEMNQVQDIPPTGPLPVQPPTPQPSISEPSPVPSQTGLDKDLLGEVGQAVVQQGKDIGQAVLSAPRDIGQGIVSAATGMAGFTAGAFAAIPKFVAGLAAGRPGEGIKDWWAEVEKVMEDVTYQPKYPGGQRIAEYAGAPFALYTAGVGGAVREAGGSEEDVKLAVAIANAVAAFGPHGYKGAKSGVVKIKDMIKYKISKGEKFTPKDIKEVEVAMPDLDPKEVKDMMDKVNALEESKEPVVKTEPSIAKNPINQEVLDGLQVEVDKRTGPRRASYNKALELVRDFEGNIKDLDLTLISKKEGKVRKLVKKLVDERKTSETVTMYHGGTDYTGGPRWLTPDIKYAEGYAAKSGGKVHSVEISKDSPYLQKSFDDTGTTQKAPYVSFEAPESMLKDMREVSGPIAEITPIDALVEESKVGEVKVDPLAEGQAVASSIAPDMVYQGKDAMGLHHFKGENNRNFSSLSLDPVEVRERFDKINERYDVSEEYTSEQFLKEKADIEEFERTAGKGELQNEASRISQEVISATAEIDRIESADIVNPVKLGEANIRLAEALVKTEELDAKNNILKLDAFRSKPKFAEVAKAEALGRTLPEIVEPTSLPIIDTPTRQVNFARENDLRIVRADLKEKLRQRKIDKELRESAPGQASPEVMEKVQQDNAALAQSFADYRKRYVQKLNTAIEAEVKAPVKEIDLALIDKDFAEFDSIKEAEEYLEASGMRGELIEDADGRVRLEPDLKDLDDYAWDNELTDYESASYVESDKFIDSETDFGELSDTGIRSLIDIFNNERGSIDITSLKIHADQLKELVAKADRLGKSVGEVLQSIGMTAEQSQKVLNAIARLPKVIEEIKKADPINEGIINPKKEDVVLHRIRPGTKGLRKNIPLTAQTFKAIHAAPKTDWDPGFAGRFMKAVETRIYAFDRYGKAVKAEFWDKWTKKLTESERERKTVVKEVKDMANSLSKKDREEISIAGISRGKGGIEALKADGIIDIPILDGRQEAVLKNMTDRYEVLWDRINYVRSKIGMAPLPKLDNYLPFIHQQNALRKAGINDSVTSAATSRIQATSKMFSGSFFPFEKTRKITNIPLELDIFNAHETYMSYAMKEIHVAPIAALAKEAAMGRVKVPKLKGGMKLMDRNPGLANMLLKWSDEIMGIDPVSSVTNANLPGISKGFHTLHKNLVAGMIFGNIGTVLKQPTALKGVMSKTSMFDTIAGAGKMIKERPTLGGKSFAQRKSNVLSVRNAELIFTEMAEAIALGKVVGARKLAGEITAAPMNWVDSITAEVGWNAGYRFAKKKLKLEETEAIQWADDMVVKTQAMGVRGAVSPIQTVSSWKWLTMLQTYAIADFNFIARDLVGIKNPDMTKSTQVKQVLRYVAGGAIMNQLFQLAGMDSPNPSPITAYEESKDMGHPDSIAMANAFKEFLEVVPLVGGSAKFSSSLLGPLGELASDVPEALNASIEALDWDNMSVKQKLKTKLLVGKTLGLAFGVPMTNQIVKSIRTSSNGGDWYETILGLYIRESKGGPPKPPKFSDGPGRFRN